MGVYFQAGFAAQRETAVNYGEGWWLSKDTGSLDYSDGNTWTTGVSAPSQITPSLASSAALFPSSGPVAVRTVRSLQAWLAWLDTVGQKGAVTEIGWPGASTNVSYAGQTLVNWGPVAESWFTVTDSMDLLVNQWLDPTGQFGAISGAQGVAPKVTPALLPILRHIGAAGTKSLQAGGAAGVAPPTGFCNTSTFSSYPTTNWFPTQQWFTLVASLGFTVVRLSFRWEIIQPTVGAALDPTALAFLAAAVARASAAGVKVILDVHNYGGYQYTPYVNAGSVQAKIGGGTITQAHFVDLWTRLSAYFNGNTAVYAYELMNEPQGLAGGTYTTTTSGTGSLAVGSTITVASTAAFPGSGQFGVTVGGVLLAVTVASGTTLTVTASSSTGTYSNAASVVSPQLQWQDCTQAAVTAIRGNTDTTLILVPGYDFAAVSRWLRNHPQGWITDTANNYRYNAHHYWSSSPTSDADYAYTWANEVAAQTFASSTGGYPRVEGSFATALAGVANRLKPLSTAITLDRIFSTGSLPVMVSGTCYWTAFIGEEDATYTQICVGVGATAATSDSTVSKLAVWEIGADKSGKLLAQTAHTSTLFTTANAVSALVNLGASVHIRPGVLYGVAALIVGGTTKPQLAGTPGILDKGLWPQMAFEKTGYSDMGNSYSPGATSSSSGPFYARLA